MKKYIVLEMTDDNDPQCAYGPFESLKLATLAKKRLIDKEDSDLRYFITKELLPESKYQPLNINIEDSLDD